MSELTWLPDDRGFSAEGDKGKWRIAQLGGEGRWRWHLTVWPPHLPLKRGLNRGKFNDPDSAKRRAQDVENDIVIKAL